MSVSRTLDACRKRGWHPEKVEHRQAKQFDRRDGFGKTKDLFGFGDVLAIQPGLVGSLIVQVTTSGQVTARCRKIERECEEAARLWLACGNRVEVWGWFQDGGKGSRWKYRRVQIVLDKGILRRYDVPDVRDVSK